MKNLALALYAACAGLAAVAMSVGMDGPLSSDSDPGVLIGHAIGFILGTTALWGVVMAPIVAIRALTKKG